MYEFRSSNRFVPVRAVEAYGGVEVRLHSFLTSPLDVVSIQLYSQEEPPHPLQGSQSLSWTLWYKYPVVTFLIFTPHTIR